MFSHTQNENGTYNTRCLYCFMTVASSVETPQELERVEAQHICPEKALADLLAREQLTPSARSPELKALYWGGGRVGASAGARRIAPVGRAWAPGIFL